ncbi:MAG TPA: alpha/beta hydrolase-fold protein [Vicinamibacteria bacterium]|nr:alpha/beta hydrolase-fold protein [Vicinamibacteria bacterium]
MVKRAREQIVDRRLAIHRLADQKPGKKEVDDFLAAHEFPLLEGPYTTFVYRGSAEAVFLGHWIYGLPSSQEFHRIEGTSLWYLVMELPAESRIEYKLQRLHEGKMEWLLDPLNPHKASDPFGDNSVCHTAGYRVPDWATPDPEARPGTLEEVMFESQAMKGKRRLMIYRPARFRPTRRYPLLIVHDGLEYIKYSGMKTVLDNLIYRLEIPGMIVAFTHPEKRLVEYANHEPHARYVTEELVPYLEREFPLLGTPRHRGLMGASFGAVASLTTAWRYPGFFGRLLLQSGSFAFTDIGEHQRGPTFDPVVQFMNDFREDPKAVSEKIFVSCGTYESLIYENRSLVPFLQRTGMEIRYRESRDGHNWENWRDRMREGLSWLFPGPLWMVYE